MFYNVRKRIFPGGTVQYFFSERPLERDYTEYEKKERTGEEVERKRKENKNRALQEVFLLARCNEWDYFVTLTFDPEKVDSFSYIECAKYIRLFTKSLERRGCRWLMVPEQHKSGRYHFHGLISGALPVVAATNAKTGEYLFDGTGEMLYNIVGFKYGFTSASKIKDKARVASYLAKYLTKELVVPKGKKSYWASRSLARPVEEYLQMDTIEFGEIFGESRYQKIIEGPYGKFVLCEREEENRVQGEVNKIKI